MAVITIPDGVRPLTHADMLAPALRDAMKELRRATLDETRLSLAEIEVIRLRCAELNGCATCFAYRIDRDDPERAARAGGRLTAELYAAILAGGDPSVLTTRERILWELCGRFSDDHFGLDGDSEFWGRMRDAFSEPEMVEAGITIMSFAMSARFNHVFGLDTVDACRLEPADASGGEAG